MHGVHYTLKCCIRLASMHCLALLHEERARSMNNMYGVLICMCCDPLKETFNNVPMETKVFFYHHIRHKGSFFKFKTVFRLSSSGGGRVTVPTHAHRKSYRHTYQFTNRVLLPMLPVTFCCSVLSVVVTRLPRLRTCVLVSEHAC